MAAGLGNYGVAGKTGDYSDLMQATYKANKGEIVNACPFGCELTDMDEYGYCHHLVGVAKDQSKEPGVLKEPGVGCEYEPIVLCEDGRRRTRIEWERRGEKKVPLLPVLKKGDKVVRITSHYRVYRKDVPVPEFVGQED